MKPSTEGFYAEAILASVVLSSMLCGAPLIRGLLLDKEGPTAHSRPRRIYSKLSIAYIIIPLAMSLISAIMYHECCSLPDAIRTVLHEPAPIFLQVLTRLIHLPLSKPYVTTYLSVVTLVILLIPSITLYFANDGEKGLTRGRLYTYRKTFHLAALALFVPFISSEVSNTVRKSAFLHR